MYNVKETGDPVRPPPLSKHKVAPMAGEGSTVDDGAAAAVDHQAVSQTGLLFVVSNRLAESGAHGIPNIQRANSRFRRIAWTVLFLAGLGMFIYQGCDAVMKYYSWPINVNIEIRALKRAEFPAVTWCNLNPVKKDALRGNQDLCDLLGDKNSGCNPKNPVDDSSAFEGYPEDWDSADISYDAEDQEYETVEAATEIVGALPYEDRALTGHRINNMLLKCTFQQKHCSPQNFSQFYNFRYGNCFTFNSGLGGVKPLDVTKTGPFYGLSMELYIQQDQYLTGVETGAGIRLLVHNQTDMPFPEDAGANLSPGSETFIGVYRTMVNRLPAPYGNCTDEFREGNLFKEQFRHLEYTRPACEKDCYFQAVLHQCGCAEVTYRYNNSYTPCNSSISNTSACMERIEDDFTTGQLNCRHCKINCNETHFRMSFSNSMWPNREYKETVQANIQQFNKDTKNMIRNNSFFIEENVLRVNVYYEDLDYEDVYQSEAYTLSTLASDLGGQVGLWIGVSVLTVCEFLELILDICVIVVTRCRAGGERARRGTKGNKSGTPKA